MHLESLNNIFKQMGVDQLTTEIDFYCDYLPKFIGPISKGNINQILLYMGLIFILENELLTLWSIFSGNKVQSITGVTNTLIRFEKLYLQLSYDIECWNLNLTKMENAYRTNNSNDKITCSYVTNDYVCCGTKGGLCYIWSRETEELLYTKAYEPQMSNIILVNYNSSLFLALGSESKLMVIQLKKLDNFKLENVVVKVLLSLSENITQLTYFNNSIYVTTKSGVSFYCIETDKNETPIDSKKNTTKLSKKLIINKNAIELFNVNNKLSGFIRCTKL